MITRLSHSTVYVLDQDIAHDFYVGTLGFTVGTDMSLSNGFRWLTVSPPKQPDLNIVLMKVDDSEACPVNPRAAALLTEILTTAGLGMGVFDCDDCRKTYEELAAKGVKFRKEPSDEFYGIEAIFEDPFGNWFSLTQRK